MRKITAIAVLLVAGFVFLQSCTSSSGPEVHLTETTHWYETSPEVSLNEYSSVELDVEFQNTTADILVFSSSPQFQLWAHPSAVDPPVVINSEPSGSVPPGGTFIFELTIDVSGLPDGDNVLGFRPKENASHGNLNKSELDMLSETVVLND